MAAEPGGADRVRIGFGYDAHRFGEAQDDGSIRLGGVDVPFERSVLAHSDGDVLLHALCDALLGAVALGDIGSHFPDTDERWRGADSIELVRACREKVAALGFGIGNVDVTLIAERPKVRAYIDAMREAIAGALACETSQVSVKATTTEKMGFEGRGEGIAAQAAVLLTR